MKILLCLLFGIALASKAGAAVLEGQYTYQDGPSAGRVVLFGANGQIAIGFPDDEDFVEGKIEFVGNQIFGDQAEDVYRIAMKDESVKCQYILRQNCGGAVVELQWFRGTAGCPASGILNFTGSAAEVSDAFPYGLLY